MKTLEFIDKLKESLETEENITVDTPLKNIEGYDSLSILSLIAFIDEHFDTSLTANQFKSLTTVKSLMDLIGQEHFE